MENPIQTKLFPSRERKIDLSKIKYKNIRINDKKLSQEDVEKIHLAIKTISQYCDGAHRLDYMGFNANDARFGHDIAAYKSISRRQAAAGLRMVWKYRKQLDQALMSDLEAIVKKSIIADNRERDGVLFLIIPQFYKNSLIEISIIGYDRMREMLRFRPSEWCDALKERCAKLGLSEKDIEEIEKTIAS